MKWIIFTFSLIIFINFVKYYYVEGYTFGTRHIKDQKSPDRIEPFKFTKKPKSNTVLQEPQIKYVKKQKEYLKSKRNIWNSVTNDIISNSINNEVTTTAINTNRSPFQVMLIGKSIFNGRYLCGGTLISREWILTAAHCTEGIHEFEVHLGAESFDDYTEPGRIILHTSNFIVHEQYYPFYALNDIALIKLPIRIEYTRKIQPVQLPSRQDLFVGEQAIASGWGSIGANRTSERLEYAELRVISNRMCKEYFSKLIIMPSTLCAWGINHANVCRGDSGGPLTLKGTNILIAVTSFGNSGGCQMGMPGGFSRITYYLDWIVSKINGV